VTFEELLAARGIVVTYEAVRQWCLKFSHQYANEIRRRRPRPGDMRRSNAGEIIVLNLTFSLRLDLELLQISVHSLFCIISVLNRRVSTNAMNTEQNLAHRNMEVAYAPTEYFTD
jgi:hypothetical protein